MNRDYSYIFFLIVVVLYIDTRDMFARMVRLGLGFVATLSLSFKINAIDIFIGLNLFLMLQNTAPLGVAAGRIDKLREFGHG